LNLENWLNTTVNVILNTDPDTMLRTVWYATHPEPNDDEPTRIARKLAGVFLVTHLEQANAPPAAVEELRQQFLELYPGMFPKKRH
jgi:hypothetical protein